MEKEIEHLLSQVDIINKKNIEILNATGGKFNIFRICGVNHYENTHSAIIAELLNPEGSHGLGCRFLDCFVKLLGINDFDCENARVITEYATNCYVVDSEKGRIDILLESGENAIIIENKLYAGDQWEQLRRYDAFAKQKYSKNNYQIYYLTLEGNEAEKESHCGVKYNCISYKTEIIDWLEKCVGIAVRFPIVRETVIQYINHLKQLTNQDMDTHHKAEVIEIIKNNLEAAEAIWQNYEVAMDEIDKSYFDQWEQQLRTEFPHLEVVREIPVHTGYNPKSVGVVLRDKNLVLWLGKDKPNGLFCHINRINSTDSLSDEERKLFRDTLHGCGFHDQRHMIWTRKGEIPQKRGCEYLSTVIHRITQ